MQYGASMIVKYLKLFLFTKRMHQKRTITLRHLERIGNIGLKNAPLISRNV